MKRLFTYLTAAVFSVASFAQDIAFQLGDGTLIENGATVTTGVHLDDTGLLYKTDVALKNLTETDQGVFLTMKAVTGTSMICCYGGCVTAEAGKTVEKQGILYAGVIEDLQIEANAFMVMGYVTNTVELTAWTSTNPDAKITATVTFSNDPEVLSVESETVRKNTVVVKDNVLQYNFVSAGKRLIQLYDVAGQLAKSYAVTGESGIISLEGMSKGLYLYSVSGDGLTNCGKVLVK